MPRHTRRAKTTKAAHAALELFARQESGSTLDPTGSSDHFAEGVQIRMSVAFKVAGISPAARYVSAIRCCSTN